MKDRTQRMQEFVNYHINGDGECNNVVLKEWARRRNLSLQDRYNLAFWFSVTYCVESAIILFEKQFKGDTLYKNQLTDIKSILVFQSDRKYMRMKDNFERSAEDFLNNHSDVKQFQRKVCDGATINLDKAIKYVSSWVMFGRFSAFLFTETFCELSGYKFENTTIDWKKGDTATSGLLNLFMFDAHADSFDKTGKLSFPKEQMDRMLHYTLREIGKAGGVTNVTEVETSLCAYRKFYKGSRYNGYYLDRMLEEIYAMKERAPKISAELIDIRLQCFDKKYLGEAGGWSGIRTDMKKLYKETGVIT